MLRGPAVNSMVGHSEEENGCTVAATASPTEVTRSPEGADFEKLLSNLSAAFIRVSVEEIDGEDEDDGDLVTATNIQSLRDRDGESTNPTHKTALQRGRG